jgi:hypothetical protein
MRIDNPIGSNAALTGSFSGSFYGNGSGLTNVAATSVEYANVLNKPTLLSGSAQIASEISGSFTAVSASFATRFDNLGSGFATDSELSSVSSSLAGDITNIYNTYATDSELASVSSSIANDITTIFTTYATDTELGIVSASLASGITGINNTINGLDNTYATDSQLAALSSSLIQVDSNLTNSLAATSSSLSEDIQGVNQHINQVSGSLATRIDNINTNINNLDSTYATDADLTLVSSSFASTTSTNVQIARLNSGSFAGRIDSINSTINNLGSTYATDSELASVSSSLSTRIAADESNLTTAIGVNNTQNNRLAALEAATGSYQAGLTFNDTTGQTGIDFTNTSGTITATLVGLGTGASPQFTNGTFTNDLDVDGDVRIDGNLYVSGTITSTHVNNLAVADNMIYLNNAIQTTITNVVGNGTEITYTTDQNHNYLVGMSVTVTGVDPVAYNVTNAIITSVNKHDNKFTVAGSTTTSYVSGGTARAKSGVNPDLGFAGGYNDGTYHHAGLFRDASDNVWKFFKGYDPEPDASIYIDTTHASFELAPLQVAQLTATSITGSLSGNASTASKLATARTITLGGDLTGNVSFDGSAGVTLTATIAADSVALGTDTTGNYVASLVAGTGISLSNNTGEGATPTITNSAPDQTVVLTAGSNVSISGTYPNFTIASTDTNTTYTASTGLSLTGTAFSIDSSVVTLSGAQTLTNKSIGGGQLVDASVTNAKLANSGVTVSPGTGMSGGGAVSLGGTITLTNAGVTSNVAGTGITVSGGTGAVTITNSDRGSSQSIFKNFAVSGQSTVVADGNDDTLTLAAGSNVTITTNASTDTITIASTDTNTTYTAGAGLTLSSTEFSHSDTSSVTNLTTSSRRYVTALTFDTYGHVTGYETGTETVTDTNTTYSVGDGGLTAVNFTTTRRDKLDGIAAGATNVTNTNQLTNGAGYITSSATSLSLSGNLTVSSGNSSGGGIILADDGDIVDLNDSFCAMRFTGGVRVHAGNRTGGVAITLASGGSITATGDITAYSDKRVKENINTIEDALDKVKALRGVTYNRTDKEDKSEKIGVIAQEIQQVLPQVVHEQEDGMLGVSYGNITAVLIEAIKEQQAQIELLKVEIAELKNK